MLNVLVLWSEVDSCECMFHDKVQFIEGQSILYITFHNSFGNCILFYFLWLAGHLLHVIITANTD